MTDYLNFALLGLGNGAVFAALGAGARRRPTAVPASSTSPPAPSPSTPPTRTRSSDGRHLLIRSRVCRRRSTSAASPWPFAPRSPWSSPSDRRRCSASCSTSGLPAAAAAPPVAKAVASLGVMVVADRHWSPAASAPSQILVGADLPDRTADRSGGLSGADRSALVRVTIVAVAARARRGVPLHPLRSGHACRRRDRDRGVRQRGLSPTGSRSSTG